MFSGIAFGSTDVIRPFCLDARSYNNGFECSPTILSTAHLFTPCILKAPNSHVQHGH